MERRNKEQIKIDLKHEQPPRRMKQSLISSEKKGRKGGNKVQENKFEVTQFWDIKHHNILLKMKQF